MKRGILFSGNRSIKLIAKRISRRLLKCEIACLLLSVPLIIINSILGVHVRLVYYLLYSLLTGLFFGLSLIVKDWHTVFAPVRTKYKRTNIVTVRRDNERVIHLQNRKIS